jgi:hypothetical protein
MAETKKNPALQASAASSFDPMNFINKHAEVILLGLLFLISYIVFKDFISFKKIYLFKDIGSDSINMYVPWVNCFADYMKNVGTPGWSFQQGMGQNIFPLWLGDWFSYVLMHLDKEKIPYYLAHMECVKIILAGLVFYKFLKELKISNYLSLLFALCYAFSGFMIMGGSWVIYSIEALYVAIILYGLERWLNHGKIFWFAFGITLLTFLQPALLMPWTFFLAPYIILRYFDLHEKAGKDLFIFLFKTAGIAAIGVCIAGYQLLPDILQVLESPRVGGESGLGDKLKAGAMFEVADPWLRFTTVFRSFGTDMIGNGNNFKGWSNYLEAPVFYCGILCLIAFPLFFTALTKRQKKFYGVVTVIFSLPIIFPYFRHMFWAFSGDYFRTFSLVIVLFLIIYSARGLQFIEQTKKLNKIVLGVTLLILLFFLYSASGQFKSGVVDTLRTFATIFLLAYAFFIFKMGDAKANNGTVKLVFLLLCSFELMYFSSGTVNDRICLRETELKEKIGYNDHTVEAVAFLKQNDKSFYRIQKDYFSGLAMHQSVNDAKAQGYYGTASYHSFNQKNYIRFLGDFGVINTKEEFNTRWAPGLGNRPLLFAVCAGKYWLSKQPTAKPIMGMGYDSLTQFGNVKVLKGKFAAPLGITYNKTFNSADLKRLSMIQKDMTITWACIIDDADAADFAGFTKINPADTNLFISYDMFANNIAALKKDSLTITSFSENDIKGAVNLQDKKILFLAFPHDEGWKATVNGTETKLYKINCGLTGMILNKGANAVELKFEPRLKKKGGMLSVAGILVLGALIGLGKFKGKKKEAA